MRALGAALRQRWRAWWQARQPVSDELQLTQRNIYIVPTRVGAAFLLTQALLLVASINDQLNLGYALTFLLFGAGLASMHTTHGNLRELRLSLLPPPPGHAGQDQALTLRLHNAGRARFGLGLRLAEGVRAQLAFIDVPAQGQAELTLHWQAGARGHHRLPLLRIETRFPLGLFVAWSYWQCASRQWVYPAVEHPAPPLPAGRAPSPSGATRSVHTQGDGEELHGVRAWREGDGQRSVLWHKAAQSSDPAAPLWVREWGAPPLAHDCWLDAADTTGLPDEARWQRLTAWVLMAERQGLDWGLRLPGRTPLPPSQGPEHRRLALEALALVGRP